MSTKQKNRLAAAIAAVDAIATVVAPVATEVPATPVADPAPTPTDPAPKPVLDSNVVRLPADGKPRTRGELKAMIDAGRATGPHVGNVEESASYKKLLILHPEDEARFHRVDGKIVVFVLPEEPKHAVLKRSAGASGGWMCLRTSDLLTRRYLDSEKPAGKSSGKALAPASDVALPE